MELAFRYWKSKTLYQAADQAGLTTAAISWPVTVAAPIDYLIAEYTQPEKTDVPPGELVKPVDLKDSIAISAPSDLPEDDKGRPGRLESPTSTIPNFVLIHLAMLDHQEHEHSPFSAQANEAIQKAGQAGWENYGCGVQKERRRQDRDRFGPWFCACRPPCAAYQPSGKGLITLRSGDMPKGTSLIESLAS
jgi:hypothetical protein